MSDIHGDIGLLDRALAWIDTDSADVEGSSVVFCGDYIDYGSDSAAVLDRLIQGPRDRPASWHFLVGNHEQMMLEASRSNRQDLREGWLQRGGAATLNSYNIGAGNAFEIDQQRFDRHLKFISEMHLWLVDEHRIFVHAGLRDIGKGHWTLDKQDENEVLWISPKDMDAAWPSRLKKLLVHGHTPFNPGVPGKRVCLDGGVGKKGGGVKVAKFVAGQRDPVHVEMVMG